MYLSTFGVIAKFANVEIVTFYRHFIIFGSGISQFLAGNSSGRRFCDISGIMLNMWFFWFFLIKRKVSPNLRGSVIARKWVPVKRFLPNLYQAKLEASYSWIWSQIWKKSSLRPLFAPLKVPNGAKWGQILFFAQSLPYSQGRDLFGSFEQW